jgi:hypothetical protein
LQLNLAEFHQKKVLVSGEIRFDLDLTRKDFWDGPRVGKNLLALRLKR